MADVSAKDVAALRKDPGAGMMDCKQALEENGGDIEAAKDWLRTKGKVAAGKRAGRSADQGAVDVLVDGGVGAIVELTAETDFVAKGADFTGVVAELAKLGENVALGRVSVFDGGDNLVDGYKHIQNGRGTIGVLVELGGVDKGDAKAVEVAHDIALHAASAAPRWTTREEVPADVIEKERAVLEELTRNEGKPDNAIPKIVEGRLGGFYKENVLVEQAFVKDAKTTVGKLLEGLGKDATVRRFVRVKIGED